MPASDEAPSRPWLDKDPTHVKQVQRPLQITNPSLISTQQPEIHRSTASARTTTPRPTRYDSQDAVKFHPSNERLGESRKPQNDRDLPDSPSIAITNRQRTSPVSIDHYHHGRPSGRGRNGHQEATSDGESGSSNSVENEQVTRGALMERKQSIRPTRISLPSQSYAQVARPLNDPQHPPGVTEGTSARGSVSHHSSTRTRPTNAQVPPGHLPEDEQDRVLEIKGSTQSPGYGQGLMDAIMSVIPSAGQPLPKDKHQLLKEEIRRTRDELRQVQANFENQDRELKKMQGDLRNANHYINQLHHEKQRSKDCIGGLQNELNNIHQQLQDAKNLSEVRGRELHGAQVFLTKADTLSISEVGEKVTALNEEIFQAAATLAEALIHKRHEASQEELAAAAEECQEMVGEKMINLLVTQSQKPEHEVNPLLVQVVLQIFMVKFCASKIQSWYPSNTTIGEFLIAIYSEIRSTGKHVFICDSKPNFYPDITILFPEEQAVSGRWRALTRAHTRPSSETWKTELYQKLTSVLKIAAWMPSSPESRESFGHRLPPIFKAVNELRMAMGEKITSADLDILVYPCDRTYDPSFMDDAYSDGRQANSKRGPEAIIGTTGIGLAKLSAERSSKDALQYHNVVSAKIVLKSTLNEALEPIQSSGIRFNKRKKKTVENADGADSESRSSSRTNLAAVNMDTT